MKVKYFDGKNSRPHVVTVQKTFNGLKIASPPGLGNVDRFWAIDGITTESFSRGDKVLLSFGEFPFERLEISGSGSEDFVFAVQENESLVQRIYHYITRESPIKLVIGSIVLLAIIIFTYVMYISPFVGEQAVKILPKSVEAKVGNIMYHNLSQTMDIDSAKSVQLVKFFEACGFQSEYDIKIDYATNDMVNAFAVPGGQIVVFEGLIRKTQSWDELAALMAHELAHVNRRHSFKQIARSVSSYFLISVLTGDVAGASSVVLENAAQVQQLSNSRTHETEADEVGLSYLQKLRIRPGAMSDLFSRLETDMPDDHNDVDDDGDLDFSTRLEYFQTHPATKNRIRNITAIIAENNIYNYESTSNPEAESIWLSLKESIGDTSPQELQIIKTIKRKLGWEDESEIIIEEN